MFCFLCVPVQTNVCNHLAAQLPFNTVTEIKLEYVADSHIATLAAAMYSNSSVTSISLSEIATIDYYEGDHDMHVTDVGLHQLLKLVQNNPSITSIDIAEVEHFFDSGFLNEELWTAIQDACEVRFCVRFCADEEASLHCWSS